MKLSIIIPVYNTGKYLKKCVESCENQDVSKDDYEIILINDGSKDDSLRIANELASEYSNIVVYDQVNSGASATRNNGIKYAKGEYIWFVDSDDYIENDVLGEIFTELYSNNLDALCIDWKHVSEEGKCVRDPAIHYMKYDGNVYDGFGFADKVLGNLLLMVSFIVRLDLIRSNGLKLKTMCYEDTDFYMRLLPVIGRIKVINEVKYFYVQRAYSLSAINKNNRVKKFRDSLSNIETALKYDALYAAEKKCGYYKRMVNRILTSNIKSVANPYDKSLYNILLAFLNENKISKLEYPKSLVRKVIVFTYNTCGLRTAIIVTQLMLVVSKLK